MRGHAPVIKDIELDFHDLVLPANLLAPEESLSLDEEPERSQKNLTRLTPIVAFVKQV